MVSKSQEDPFRSDAAIVWRAMRDFGPQSAVALQERCFPLPAVEMPESTRKELLKRQKRRVFNSIVWMRHSGVAITAVPDAVLTVFHLGVVEIDVRAVPRGVRAVAEVTSERVVTAKVAQPSDHTSDSMDVWHGKG